MEMLKFRLAVLVLLAITTIYAITLFQSHQNFQLSQKEILKGHPEATRPYIDLAPFLLTPTGKPFISYGVACLLSWLILLYFKPKTAQKDSLKNKMIATVLMVMFMCGFFVGLVMGMLSILSTNRR